MLCVVLITFGARIIIESGNGIYLDVFGQIFSRRFSLATSLARHNKSDRITAIAKLNLLLGVEFISTSFGPNQGNFKHKFLIFSLLKSMLSHV